MSDARLSEQLKMFGISKENITVDDVLILMELFALPYKAVVLRLVESGEIKEGKAQELLKVKTSSVTLRIELTGRAQQWQQNSRLLRYGSLLENLAYNFENEFLTDSREDSDKAYLEKIKKGFQEES